MFLILLAVVGLVMGGLARLALPGKDPMSLPQTMAVGLAGSFLAGIVSWLISGSEGPSLLVSFVFTVLIVYLIRRSRGGGLTEPGRTEPRR